MLCRGQPQCPGVIGGDGSQYSGLELMPVNSDRSTLYLSRMNNVSCSGSSGNVTRWKLCYHNKEETSFPINISFGIFPLELLPNRRYTLRQAVALATLTVSGNENINTDNDNLTCAELADQDPVDIPETNPNEVLVIGVCVGPRINGGINYFISKLIGTNESMTSIATQSPQGQTLVCNEQTVQLSLGSNNMASVILEDQPFVIHISGTINGKSHTVKSNTYMHSNIT